MKVLKDAKKIRYKGQNVFLRVDELGNVKSYLLNDGFARSQGYKNKIEMVRVCFTHGNLFEFNRKNIWLTPKPTDKEAKNSLISKFQEIYNKTKKE